MAKPTPDELAELAYRILAVSRGAPRQQQALDRAAAEIGTMIGDLCESLEKANELTEHLVHTPATRYDFHQLQRRAVLFCRAPAKPAEPAPLNWYGWKVPEWAFEPPSNPPAANPELANQFQIFADLVDAEAWRRVEAWPATFRRQREQAVLDRMAAYQRDHPRGPFQDPTPEQIREQLIMFALHDHHDERAKIGSLEELSTN